MAKRINFHDLESQIQILEKEKYVSFDDIVDHLKLLIQLTLEFRNVLGMYIFSVAC